MWRILDADRGESIPYWTVSLRGVRERTAGSLFDPGLFAAIREQTRSDDDRLRRACGLVPTWLQPGELDDLGRTDVVGTQPVFTLQLQSPGLRIWIEDEVVVFRKPAESTTIRIVNEPSDAEAFQWLAGRNMAQQFGARAELELFSVTGDNSVESGGAHPFRNRGLSRRALARFRAEAGWVVGRVAQFVTVGSGDQIGDPFWEKRFSRLEAAKPDLRDAVPLLKPKARYDATALPPEGLFDELVVLVHGTMSSAMHMAAAIYPSPTAAFPPYVKAWPRVLRFEHDTFLPCEENASQLSERLLQYKKLVRRVLLVAHSRGGLVAASAAHEIQADGTLQVGIHTFGSPHAGTPIVRGGISVARTLAGFAETGAQLLGSALKQDALGWLAGKALSGYIELPKGLADMDAGNSYLRSGLKRAFLGRTEAVAWAAEFDPRQPDAEGRLPGFFLNARSGLFNPKDATHTPNDGVVPVASAQHPKWKNEAVLKNCDHSGYFDKCRATLVKRIGG